MAATAQAPVTLMSRRRGSHALAAKQMSLGMTKASWRSHGAGTTSASRPASGAVAGVQPQVARGGPVRVKVLIAAGKARQATVGHKDAARQLGKLGAQVVQALVKVLEQIAQEQVEVHARKLLAYHGRR